MDYTKNDAESLAAKLAGLELSGAERAALDAVFEAAFDDDAEVFGLDQGNRYFKVLWADSLPKTYIGETEKNVAVFEPNNHP